MYVRQARAAARRWLDEAAPHLPGLVGAYLAGSTNWLPPDATLPTGTDVDVMVVLEGDKPPLKLGKFIYAGALLEVTYLAADQLRTPEQVLGDYHLAPSLHTGKVIDDRGGQLTALQAAVSQAYAQRVWVRRRCQQAYEKIQRQLRGLESAPTWPDQVLTWLFSTGVMTHVLLVAGLRNPTVRRRYVAVRELLEEMGRAEEYPPLLSLLGCARMEPGQVEAHLAALVPVFDAMQTVDTSPFFFSGDLSQSARPIAIDGSRALLDQGNHREAIFWIAATYSCCMLALLHSAPDMEPRYAPGYARLLGDLGIHDLADLQARRTQVFAHLPHLWRVAEAIMARNVPSSPSQ